MTLTNLWMNSEWISKMTAYNVIVTKPAERDIRGIYRYIKNKLQNREAAERRIDLIHEKLKSLEDKPYRYPLVLDEFLASLGLRSVMAENHVLFYVIREKSETVKKSTVSVIRVMYGRRDWASILKDDIENIFDEIE